MDYGLDRNIRKIAEVLVRKVPDDQQVGSLQPCACKHVLILYFLQGLGQIYFHSSVPGPACGRAGKCGLRKVDPAGRPDAGRVG